MKGIGSILAVCCLAMTVSVTAAGQYREGRPYSDLNDSEVVSSLKNHIQFLSSAALEGRKAGSQGEEEAALYLARSLEKKGVDLLTTEYGDEFGMKQENGDTLTSRNLVAFIPGYDEKLREEYIVIGARLDNLGSETVLVDGQPRTRIFNGANGNASGLAMLIELAGRLKTNAVLLRRSVLFIGFGSSRSMEAGSWYFLNRAFQGVDKIKAMINLDMLGTGNYGFWAYTSSNPDLNAIVNSVNNTLQPIQPEITSEEPYASDHRSFYEKKIPSVLFTTGRYPEHDTERDTGTIIDYGDMERELEYIYNFSVSLINGNAPVFDVSEELKKHDASGKKVIPYYECDWKPTFLGSSDPRRFMERWVYQYLKYPTEAVHQGIQGRVLVEFVIDEKGRVRDAKVLRGVDPLLDDEAVRVISASPDWKPGRVGGKKVKCRMSLYVDFVLEKKGTGKFSIKQHQM